MTATVIAKVKTPTMTAEIRGAIAGVIVELFAYIPDENDRQRTLDMLHDVDRRLIAGKLPDGTVMPKGGPQ